MKKLPKKELRLRKSVWLQPKVYHWLKKLKVPKTFKEDAIKEKLSREYGVTIQ